MDLNLESARTFTYRKCDRFKTNHVTPLYLFRSNDASVLPPRAKTSEITLSEITFAVLFCADWRDGSLCRDCVHWKVFIEFDCE